MLQLPKTILCEITHMCVCIYVHNWCKGNEEILINYQIKSLTGLRHCPEWLWGIDLLLFTGKVTYLLFVTLSKTEEKGVVSMEASGSPNTLVWNPVSFRGDNCLSEPVLTFAFKELHGVPISCSEPTFIARVSTSLKNCIFPYKTIGHSGELTKDDLPRIPVVKVDPCSVWKWDRETKFVELVKKGQTLKIYRLRENIPSFTNAATYFLKFMKY